MSSSMVTTSEERQRHKPYCNTRDHAWSCNETHVLLEAVVRGRSCI